MTPTPFYHSTIKNTILAFGSLFSDISFVRSSDGTEQTIKVPIAYAQKEKWVQSVEQNADGERGIYTPLPKLAFELTSISYDSSRALNANQNVSCYNDGELTVLGMPAPYVLGFDLHFATKTQGDSFQILEQILPYFKPKLNMKVKVIPSMNIVHELPVILNSVSFQDDYEGDLETRRFVVYTLSFNVKVNLYPGTSDSGLIKQVEVALPEQNVEYIASQETPISDIIESWNINI